MNYLCIYPQEISDGRARLEQSRAEHARRVHAVVEGSQYLVAVPTVGRARAIVQHVADAVVLKLDSFEQLEPVRDITLIVGVCRPQTVKKVLQAAVSFQVARVIFLQSINSEKSYFGARPLVDPLLQERLLVEAVEQTGIPLIPEVLLERRFKAFVEDSLTRFEGAVLLADTHAKRQQSEVLATDGKITVVIGPEKGWSEFERQKLLESGSVPCSLGAGQLRIETATVALLSRVRQFDCCFRP